MRPAQQLSEAQKRVTELEAAQANQAVAVDEATARMGAKIDDLRQRLADSSEQLAETTEALRRTTERAKSVEQRDMELERTIEQEQGECAVAAEAPKWEERESYFEGGGTRTCALWEAYFLSLSTGTSPTAPATCFHCGRASW